MASITRNTRTNGERRDEGEQRLLAAVESLLADGWSYTELPILKIAEQAGMSRSTFYSYFPDKGQLLIRLTDRVYQSLSADVWPWWFGDHRGGAADIAVALEGIIAEYRSRSPAVRAVQEAATYDEQVDKYYRARLADYADALAQRLEEQKAKGHVHPAVNAVTTAHVMIAMTDRTIAEHIAAGSTDDAELAQTLGRALWLTMYGDAKRPPAPITRG